MICKIIKIFTFYQQSHGLSLSRCCRDWSRDGVEVWFGFDQTAWFGQGRAESYASQMFTQGDAFSPPFLSLLSGPTWAGVRQQQVFRGAGCGGIKTLRAILALKQKPSAQIPLNCDDIQLVRCLCNFISSVELLFILQTVGWFQSVPVDQWETFTGL